MQKKLLQKQLRKKELRLKKATVLKILLTQLWKLVAEELPLTHQFRNIMPYKVVGAAR
jgi:hypothetical protein